MSDVTPTTDRFETARTVADAVLYEGYVLYPYRASSRKNQVRFQWGVLTPRRFSETEGSERWSMRTECLVDPGPDPLLHVRLRCLQAQHRSIEGCADRGGFAPVEYLEVDGTLNVDWDEAVDQIVDLAPLSLVGPDPDPDPDPDADADHVETFTMSGGADTEEIRAADGSVVGRFVRHREPVEGVVRVSWSRPDRSLPYVKVGVTVQNTTTWSDRGLHRDNAMAQSLIAVHIMLAVDDGTFVSLLDPPAAAASVVGACRSDGAYPVLIGDDDVVLASPIILYDHPEVAPQSPGDLYDSLEIDEILALRVMTLTDQEKSEARGTDPRAAAIIDRCDDMSAETLSQLHGQMRPVEPFGVPAADFTNECSSTDASSAAPWWDPEVDASFDPWTESVWVAGVEITKGSAVRLQPSHRADAHDIFLVGMAATVAGVFTDVDGDQHVAVTVDDDPATEELMWQGRYLFFHPDEVQPLVDQDQSR
ncbi:MAG TPA: hypothetical protein VHV57_17680 [Acidimicrobiales bacterium]|nr:hypothetical protein [Acidimicrobiales bacterium]